MHLVKFSIIIPTFKREKQLVRILKKLKNQISNKFKLDIIICDSYSKYNLKLFPKNNKNFKISYFNLKKNILSTKRNYGIKKSKFRNIILIDDDCIPEKNFLVNYFKSFQNTDSKSILSGIINYPKNYLKVSNYLKYRSSRHFKILEGKNFYFEKLPANKIVAMNMGFVKSKKFTKIGYFNEGFVGYGFEDFEFGYRYKKFGFKLVKTNASITHDEGKPDLDKYLTKFYHLGRDGMRNLKILNASSAATTSYFKLENNIFFKILINIPKIDFLLLKLQKIIFLFEKLQIIYLPYLYTFLRVISYTRGVLDRDKKKLKPTNRNWYE